MNTVLTFAHNGIVFGLYTEAIPLEELGTLEVIRMTETEFNSATQRWEARDKTGSVLFSHPSRQACIEWEHRAFNQ